MKTIQLGSSDLHVTPICLGTMTFGEQVDAPRRLLSEDERHGTTVQPPAVQDGEIHDAAVLGEGQWQVVLRRCEAIALSRSHGEGLRWQDWAMVIVPARGPKR